MPEIASLLYSHLISNAHNFCVHFYYLSHAPSELSPLYRHAKMTGLEETCKIKNQQNQWALLSSSWPTDPKETVEYKKRDTKRHFNQQTLIYSVFGLWEQKGCQRLLG